MSTVFFDVGISLNGCLAGPNGGPHNPLGDGGSAIHEWMFRTRAFRERHGLADGPVTGASQADRAFDVSWYDEALIEEVFERTGAYIMGRRMFEEGEQAWPADAPFRAPVFVLTHRPRNPWPRPGGTTFHFITGGPAEALRRAREAAGGKDVRVAGGADTIRQFLEAGWIEEFTVHVAPVLVAGGIRLLDQAGAADLALEQLEASNSPRATHIRYRVLRPGHD